MQWQIATRNGIIPGRVRLALAHPLTKPPAMRKHPSAGLGPATVQPPTNHSGVGPGVSSKKSCGSDTPPTPLARAFRVAGFLV